jgi:hypothetical protein
VEALGALVYNSGQIAMSTATPQVRGRHRSRQSPRYANGLTAAMGELCAVATGNPAGVQDPAYLRPTRSRIAHGATIGGASGSGTGYYARTCLCLAALPRACYFATDTYSSLEHANTQSQHPLRYTQETPHTPRTCTPAHMCTLSGRRQ